MDGEAIALESAAGRYRPVQEREHVDSWATFLGAGTTSANLPSQASHPTPPVSQKPGVARCTILTLQQRLLKPDSHDGMIAALAH